MTKSKAKLRLTPKRRIILRDDSGKVIPRSKGIKSDADFIKFIATSGESNATAIRLLCYLYSRLNNAGWTPPISSEELCEELQCTRSTIFKALGVLRSKGYIPQDSKKGFGEASKYRVTIYGSPIVRDSK